MRSVVLGRTGLRVSRLCFGTGTNGWNGSSDQTRIGHDALVRLLRSAYRLGVSFWDSADGYGSHSHIADALEGLDRGSVVISTKTHARTREAAEASVPRSLRELRTDYVDILLMHYMTRPDWTASLSPVIDALRGAKDQGLVRAIGASCHSVGALEAAAEADWVDVVMARVNYDGVHMEAPHAEVIPVLERMHEAGKGVIGMKVLGQGQLAHDVRRAIRYALGLRCLDAITIGMTSQAQLTENVKLCNEFG